MIGDVKITDKDGKPISADIISAMMPLKFEVETTLGNRVFTLHYSHPRDEGRRDTEKIKGIVLNTNHKEG